MSKSRISTACNLSQIKDAYRCSLKQPVSGIKHKYQNLIQFVPASAEKSLQDSISSTNVKLNGDNTTLTGKEAMDFYKDLISSNDSSNLTTDMKSNEKNPRRRVSRNVDSETKASSSCQSVSCRMKLLRHSQEGDVSQVEECLEIGVPVDVQDQFGWTPLMIAAYEGHVSVVECLMKHGANAAVFENQGLTAVDLARQNGQHQIRKVFDRLQNVSKSTRKNFLSESQLFYCKVCMRQFSDITEKCHQTSTVHLFNLQLKPKSTTYLIPETNIGYKMLVNEGWNCEQGLGPAGQGQKFPVRTVLKRDRHGLGTGHMSRPKVTHFASCDRDAVKAPWKTPTTMRKTSVKTLSKRALRYKERRERDWERKLRIYMNSN